MARMRTLAPGFFLNEELARLSPQTRLLFAGLWCVADRNGRLEDRPARIKAEVLPYDDCDVDALLGALAEAGFIQRYVSGGRPCISVVNFQKYQKPHWKERESVLPPPADVQRRSMVKPSMERLSRMESDAFPPDTGLMDTGLMDTGLMDTGHTDMAADAAVHASEPEPHVDDQREVFEEYRVRIQPKANFLDDAQRKIGARLRRWSREELRAAIAHFAADSWQMEHNAHRGAAWFFATDSRIEQYLNLEPKEETKRGAADRPAERPRSELAKYAAGPRPQPG